MSKESSDPLELAIDQQMDAFTMARGAERDRAIDQANDVLSQVVRDLGQVAIEQDPPAYQSTLGELLQNQKSLFAMGEVARSQGNLTAAHLTGEMLAASNDKLLNAIETPKQSRP